MGKTTKIWLVVAIICILSGAITFVAVMSGLDWNFKQLGGNDFVTNTHTLTETFDDIAIEIDTADVELIQSTDGQNKVVCHEQENVRHVVSVTDGTLKIKTEDNRKWHEKLFSFGENTITVYLVETQYNSLIVNGDTNDTHN